MDNSPLSAPRTKKITAVYFSPTGTSKRIARAIAGAMATALNMETADFPLTLPADRKNLLPEFGEGDVLVLALPVYAGRVPAIAEPIIKKLSGRGTPAVAAAVYGNRDYDDALLEMSDILSARGFRIAAAGVFIGEHSLSGKVGGGRPDAADLKAAENFGKAAAEKIAKNSFENFEIKGNRPYRERPAAAPCAPKTGENCAECMICAQNCPAGAISFENPREISEGCLRCCACVKGCPSGSKFFDDEIFAKFKAFLEANCAARKDPELFY